MRRTLALLVLGLVFGAPLASFVVLLGVTAAYAVASSDPVPSVSPIPDATPADSPSPSSSAGDSATAPQIGVLITGNPAINPSEAATPAATSPAAVPSTPLVVTANRLVLNRLAFLPGDTLVATGHGFGPTETVRFLIYPGAVAVGSGVASAAGDVTMSTVLAPKADAGGYTIEGTSPTRVASKNFVIASIGTPGTPTIPPVLIPLVGVCGIAVVVSSAGFIGFGGFHGIATRFLTGGRL